MPLPAASRSWDDGCQLRLLGATTGKGAPIALGLSLRSATATISAQGAGLCSW